MRSLLIGCCCLMFAFASFADESTVANVPATPVVQPAVQPSHVPSVSPQQAVVVAKEAERAAMQAKLEAREAEIAELAARRSEALEQKKSHANEKPDFKRDSRRGLDDPTGSCCYSYFGYNYCLDGVTESECFVLNSGFQWDEGATCDMNLCPPTILGRCCYQGTYCEPLVSQIDCEQWYGGVWQEGMGCEDAPSCFPLGRCCYDWAPYCTDGISEQACNDWYGGGGGGDEIRSGNSLDATWQEGLSCADAPTCIPPLGRCCYDLDGLSCIDNVSQYECENYYFYGVWTEGLTCNNPCPEPEYGRCCYDYAPYCNDGMTANACAYYYAGAWEPGLTCADEPTCIPPLGRCCYEYAPYCSETISELECVNSYSGIWTEGATCADEPDCTPPLGRCCYNDAGFVGCVSDVTGWECLNYYGGQWVEGAVCDGSCPEPVGRCCYGSPQAPSCQTVSAAECDLLNGQWNWVYTCDNNPCPVIPNALRVITVPVPSSLGVCISADCRGDLYYTNYSSPYLHRMDAFGNLISTNSILDASGAPHNIDEMGWDEGRQLFWGGELGTNAIYTVDRNGLATYQFPGMGGYTLTDGCDFDATDGTIWHSTDVSSDIAHFSSTGLLLGTLTLYDENGNPEGAISGVEVGAAGTIWAGNSPIDDVRRCNKTTGAFVSRFDAGQVRCEGMECDAINFAPQTVMWVKDAYNNTVTAFEIETGTCVCSELPDTCQFPYQEVDHGDLAACNYPTLVNNPAHGLSGIAWLGPMIDGEAAPEILNMDQLPEDDGVFFVDLPWNPCEWESVYVDVTAGIEYARYEECGGHLYLNAWKDGNLDGDFCDRIPCDGGLLADEWIIRDRLVTPGHHEIPVLDPGVLNLGRYDGVFRFRLTSTPVGRYGFGLAVVGACTEQCGTFAFDFLGEVEDYIVADGQLDVELSSFDAVAGDGEVALSWATASETDNAGFEILRDGVMLADVASLGNTASGHSYTWTDESAVNGTTYSYALVARDIEGGREEIATVSATPRAGAGVITEYALHNNYPNPFNPTTTISFDLVEAGFTSLKVYNIQGQEVATLVSSNMTAGSHHVLFDAASLPSGMYLYRLSVNGFSAEQKMLLLK